ncbi:MAG TPA: NTP transferase domain-containing protein [Candidatus Binatia bacterium]|nr:NTP transferase domain-containing protein [Candidatus Binatia bacterium]
MIVEPAKDNATAVVLAGGKSSRMGRPKALLPFDGEPLIRHLVRTLAPLFAEVVVVGGAGAEFVELMSLLRSLSSQPNELNEPNELNQPNKPYQPNQPNELNKPNELNQPNEPNLTLVRDEIAYQGPVGGIYYGLREAKGEFVFLTSCDAPFLNLALISHLISQISDYDVVVPYWQERFQPLHAVYRRSVAPLLGEQLERGELRPIFLYEKVRTRRVSEDEIRRFDPEGLSFLNMNTPEDYEAALKRWQRLAEEQRGRGGPHPSALAPMPPGGECTVELFSVARLLAKTSKIDLALPREATLADVLAALSDRLPVLVGPIIATDRKSLTSGNACNINGRTFVRDPKAPVQPGDSIFIISADAGG